MKIIFIYPGITENGFGSSKGNEGSWISHGLCSLSAVLKKNGYEVSVIDLRQLSGWDDFALSVRNHTPGIFGITVMSVDLNTACTCAEIIKKINGKNLIIFGGPHPSIAPEEVLGNEYVDHVISGEAEISFLELVRNRIEGRPAERFIKGKIPDLDSLPFTDRKLFLLPEEPFVDFLKPPFVTIIAGRGCSYNCSYCQPAERKIFGNKVRRRSVPNVISELRQLDKETGFNSFMFHDDCLTEDMQWIENFCHEYKKTGLRQKFVCQSRADLICKNKSAVKMLKHIGLELMIIGFESGSQRVLDFLSKGTKVEQNYDSAEICRRVGIKIWANYMLGLPGETKREQKMTVDMIKKIRPYHCSPAFYTPHPGSRLYDYCHRQGLSLIKYPKDYRRNTYEPKITGIDYDYLKKILYESILCGEDIGGKQTIRKLLYFLKANRFISPFVDVKLLKQIRALINSAGYVVKNKVIAIFKKRKAKIINLISEKSAYSVKYFVNMENIKNINGIWQAKSATDDPQIFLYNAAQTPFNADIYFCVRFHLYSDAVAKGHFTWWHLDGKWQTGMHFAISKGWKQYRFNMKNMPTYGKLYGSDIKWQGAISCLRFDPSEQQGIRIKLKKVVLSNLP